MTLNGRAQRSRALSPLPHPAICGLLACIIFGAVIDDLKEERDFSVGFSLGLAIAAFFFNLIAAGLLTIDSRTLSYHNVSDAVRRGGAGMMYVLGKQAGGVGEVERGAMGRLPCAV